MIIRSHFFVGMAALWVLISPLYGSPLMHPHVKADLISENRAIAPLHPFWIAIRLQMEKGWHTYWKNPGDSGLSTRVQWHLPKGFIADPVQWPCPNKILVPPVTSYG